MCVCVCVLSICKKLSDLFLGMVYICTPCLKTIVCDILIVVCRSVQHCLAHGEVDVDHCDQNSDVVVALCDVTAENADGPIDGNAEMV